MKKLILCLLICATINFSWATVRTVCNMAYSPGQYTNFAAALTASAVNDTIYVHGSSINYGAITVNKSGIVIIGTGHNPGKTVPLVSLFTTITVSAASCQFIGLAFNILYANSGTTSLTVKRCKLQITNLTDGIDFSGLTTADNALIEGNVFIGTSPNYPIWFANGTTNNTIIRNNIFNGNSYAMASNSPGTIAFTFQVINNLFLGSSFGTFASIYNAIINNNIFYRSSPQGTSTGSAMNNNISFQCANNNFSAAGSNNLVNVNPLFTSFPLPGAIFDYSHDYHLTAGSPGHANGTDGTDRGIYGGFGSKFNMSGEPAIAEVTDFTITSPTTIAPGGTLTISVTSKRVD